jgi:thiol:disulfide interchange protein
VRRLLIALFLLWTVPGYAAGSKPAQIGWQPWSDDVFERAARENRFVLLDLEAVWCHWCHVMDESPIAMRRWSIFDAAKITTEVQRSVRKVAKN